MFAFLGRHARRGPIRGQVEGELIGVCALDMLAAMVAGQVRVFPVDILGFDFPAISGVIPDAAGNGAALFPGTIVAQWRTITRDEERRVSTGPSIWVLESPTKV